MSRHDLNDKVVGELHALLKGDTGFKMADGDVELIDADAEDGLVVDIRGRRFEIIVRDVGPSARATLSAVIPTPSRPTESRDFRRWVKDVSYLLANRPSSLVKDLDDIDDEKRIDLFLQYPKALEAADTIVKRFYEEFKDEYSQRLIDEVYNGPGKLKDRDSGWS